MTQSFLIVVLTVLRNLLESVPSVVERFKWRSKAQVCKAGCDARIIFKHVFQSPLKESTLDVDGMNCEGFPALALLVPDEQGMLLALRRKLNGVLDIVRITFNPIDDACVVWPFWGAFVEIFHAASRPDAGGDSRFGGHDD